MTLQRLPLFLTILGSLGLPLAVAGNQAPEPASYHEARAIPIQGKGGWDDLSMDPEGHRLFVSHADRVVVIDTEQGKVIREIPDTPGVHGIALALDLKKAFSSNGREGMVSVIDLQTLATTGKIKVGENPDAILYESGRHEVYAFNGKSNSVSIIDASAAKVTATVTLPGKPEFAAADPERHRVYVNIEDHNSVVALDTRTHAIVATWPLRGCESPSGIALDLKDNRLFSVCENEKMVMIDGQSGRILASIPTGQGTDGAAFDSERGLVFSSNGRSGTLTVARVEMPDRLSVVGNVRTEVGARTMTLDPRTHRLYLPTASFQKAAPGARPKPIDGTQRILVLEP